MRPRARTFNLRSQMLRMGHSGRRAGRRFCPQKFEKPASDRYLESGQSPTDLYNYSVILYNHSVILSAANTPRSGVLAESKDPVSVDAANGLREEFRYPPEGLWKKLLSRPLALPTCRGSFALLRMTG